MISKKYLKKIISFQILIKNKKELPTLNVERSTSNKKLLLFGIPSIVFANFNIIKTVGGVVF